MHGCVALQNQKDYSDFSYRLRRLGALEDMVLHFDQSVKPCPPMHLTLEPRKQVSSCPQSTQQHSTPVGQHLGLIEEADPAPPTSVLPPASTTLRQPTSIPPPASTTPRRNPP